MNTANVQARNAQSHEGQRKNGGAVCVTQAGKAKRMAKRHTLKLRIRKSARRLNRVDGGEL